LTEPSTSSPPILFEDFLAHLRRLGFTIGVDQYLRVQQVIGRLSGECSPADLKLLLCPLLAANQKQQEAFYSAFDAFLPLLSAKVQGPGQAEAPTVREQPEAVPARRWTTSNWLYYSCAVVLLGGLAGLAAWRSRLVTPPEAALVQEARPLPPTSAAPKAAPWETAPQPPVSRFPFDVATTLVVFGPFLLFLAYELHRLGERRFALHQQAGRKPPHSWPIRVEGRASSVYSSPQFAAAARRLHSRQAAESCQLDLSATCEATAASVGYPVLRFRPDTRPSEYLVLIDRASAHDHHAALFTQFAEALHGQGLYVDHYYFDGDPRVCWAPEGRAPVRLSDLQLKRRGHRLLLIGNGEHLTDPLTGQLAGWARSFSAWADRAILTCTPVSSWGARERTLANQFLILPATTEALFSLIDFFSGAQPGEIPALGARLPEELASDVPPAEMVERLRDELGPGLFLWVCACAIYPELHWDLTLYLASLPRMPEGLVTEENLLRLIRISWFRAGSIPDEARYELIRRIDPVLEHEVREAVLGVLESNPAADGTFASSRQALEIAVNRYVLGPSKRERRAARQSLQRLSADGSVGESVVLRSLDSAETSPLDLVLPRRLRRLIYGHGIPVLGLRTAIRLALTFAISIIGFAGISYWRDAQFASRAQLALSRIAARQAIDQARWARDQAKLALDQTIKGVPVPPAAELSGPRLADASNEPHAITALRRLYDQASPASDARPEAPVDLTPPTQARITRDLMFSRNYIQEGKLDDAEYYIKDAENLDPTSTRIVLARAELLQARKQLAQAAELLRNNYLPRVSTQDDIAKGEELLNTITYQMRFLSAPAPPASGAAPAALAKEPGPPSLARPAPASPAAPGPPPGPQAGTVVSDSFQSVRDVADRLRAEYEDVDAKTVPEVEKLMLTKVCQINRISPLLDRAREAMTKWLEEEKEYWQLWGDAEARRVEGQYKSLAALQADQELARTEVESLTKDRQDLVAKRTVLEQTTPTEEVRQVIDALSKDIADSGARLTDAQKSFDELSKRVSNMQASMSARLIAIRQNTARLTAYGLQMDAFYAAKREAAAALCTAQPPGILVLPNVKGPEK
jgi:hypothetical protein